MESGTANLEEHVTRIVPRGAKLLLAVSGGVDSMALFHAVLAVREKHNLQIVVAHVDHSLRASSADDMKFVEAAVAAAGVECFCAVLGRPPENANIEAWGRDERYRFFERILGERSLDWIVTAHHANDLAETVLMRFLANREPTSIHAIDAQRRLIRPFLDVSREQMEAYVRSSSIAFRDDPSNDNVDFLRNRYRKNILPFLQQQLETDLVRVLAERAESLEDDASALEAVARSEVADLQTHSLGSKDWFRALREKLSGQPRAISWRIVERILAEKYGSFFGRRTSLRVLHFIESGETAVELPGGHRVKRFEGGLQF